MANEESDDVVTSADSGPESTSMHLVRAQLLAISLELQAVKNAHAELLEQAHRFNEVVLGNETLRAKVLAEDVEGIEHRRANRSTLRDYFAASALNGLLLRGTASTYNELAFAAYAYAGGMLVARARGAE